MAHFPTQPGAEYCRHGPVRCSDRWLRSAVCARHHGLERRDLLDVTANPAAEWIAHQITEAFPWADPALPDPRPGSGLRGRCDVPIASHRYPRQARRSCLPMAKRLRREADWIDPARVHRSCARLRRGAFAPDPAVIRALLQHGGGRIDHWTRTLPFIG